MCIHTRPALHLYPESHFAKSHVEVRVPTSWALLHFTWLGLFWSEGQSPKCKAFTSRQVQLITYLLKSTMLGFLRHALFIIVKLTIVGILLILQVAMKEQNVGSVMMTILIVEWSKISMSGSKIKCNCEHVSPSTFRSLCITPISNMH